MARLTRASQRIRLNSMRKIFLALAGFALLGLVALFAAEEGLFPVLATKSLMGKQAAGYYILPTNQLLRPWGDQTLIKGRPVDMAFDSAKRLLAVLNGHGVELFLWRSPEISGWTRFL